MAEDKLKCDLCQSKKKNELKYGKFYVKNKLKVHYFCLLLSTGLAQEGDDDEGILGFLPMDIQAEKRRIKQKMCIYCKEKGANISCCEAKCKNNFHFICGINNGAQNHFLDTFPSFCHQHADNPKKYKKSSKEACSICWESFSRNEPQTMAISTPCCKNGWFHKWCLQEFANKAGYFFKCPLCNDTSIFSREIPKSGIFIPQKDADWELEPGAFEDLLVRPSECSARQCACKSGRNFTNDELFKFLLCQICGGKAIHKFCHVGNWKMSDEKYLCLECSDMVNKLNLHEYSKDSGIVVINKNNFENDVINIEDSLDSDENLTNEDKQVNQISSNYFSEDFVLCNRNDSVEKKGKRCNRKRQKRIESPDNCSELLEKKKVKRFKTSTLALESDCSFELEGNSKTMKYKNCKEKKTANSDMPNENIWKNKICNCLTKDIKNKGCKTSEKVTECSNKKGTHKNDLTDNSFPSSSNPDNVKYKKSSFDSIDYFDQPASNSRNQFEKNCRHSKKFRGRRIFSSNEEIFKNSSSQRDRVCLKQNLYEYNNKNFLTNNENKGRSSEQKKICLVDTHTLKTNHYDKYNDLNSKETDDIGFTPRSRNQNINKNVNIHQTEQRKYLCIRDPDSDSSTSSFAERNFTRNKSVLRKNLKNKLTPINLKIRSKYAKFRKSKNSGCTIRIETKN